MTPIDRMLLSLQGLSIGDAFGETFFTDAHIVRTRLENRELPPPPWCYTDDTEMALSIVDVLRRLGRIDPDELAEDFARRYDPRRGYGGGAHWLLSEIRAGADWREVAPGMFNGTGSYGNGSAMRVAPLGAYFADDLDGARENAALSAKPTHAHPEGAAGAIAVAIATALAAQTRGSEVPAPQVFLKQIIEWVPESKTREGIAHGVEIPCDPQFVKTDNGKSFDIAPARAAEILGSGQNISAQDTVPFTLWCAARHLGNYEDALWAAASGLGDVDTTCAIVGGIVAVSAHRHGIPGNWLKAREPLPVEFHALS